MLFGWPALLCYFGKALSWAMENEYNFEHHPIFNGMLLLTYRRNNTEAQDTHGRPFAWRELFQGSGRAPTIQPIWILVSLEDSTSQPVNWSLIVVEVIHLNHMTGYVLVWWSYILASKLASYFVWNSYILINELVTYWFSGPTFQPDN